MWELAVLKKQQQKVKNTGWSILQRIFMIYERWSVVQTTTKDSQLFQSLLPLPTLRTSIQLCPYTTLPWSPSEGRLAFAQNFPITENYSPPSYNQRSVRNHTMLTVPCRLYVLRYLDLTRENSTLLSSTLYRYRRSHFAEG